ncbi:hypothetical protein ABPG74_017103 [Tetrahymena malaccensis]
MNIKLGKKFILGQQQSSDSPSQRSFTQTNRGIKSPLHNAEQEEIPQYIQPPTDPTNSMPVRDQINKLENFLNEFENDLKQSKQDMEQIRQSFSKMEDSVKKQWDLLFEECSQKVQETGDRIYNIQQQINEMTDKQVADVLILRGQYDESVQFAKNLNLKVNVIENDVGFKIVYKF